MSPASGTTQAMELAARSVDLAGTILHHADLDIVSLVVKAASTAGADLVKWLARERISEGAFTHAMSLAQNLASPNSRGLQILDGLARSATRLFSLQIAMPGSLGRLIVYDERLRWIGTTEAVLLLYHTPETIIDTISDILAAQQFSKASDPRLSVVKLRIRPVIAKVVDSIHLHVVNTLGSERQSLPEAIRDLRPHFLNPQLLAVSIRAIQATTNENITVLMEACALDLTDWIFHHWNGMLVVVLGNKVEFRKQMGFSPHSLTLVITNKCSQDLDCSNQHHITKIDIGVSGDSFQLRQDRPRYDTCTDPEYRNTASHCRSELYDIRNPYQTLVARLTTAEQRTAMQAAQDVVRSIVELPVSPRKNFDAEIELKQDQGSHCRLRWWLRTIPTLLQRNLGSPRKPRLLHVEDATRAQPWDLESGERSSIFTRILDKFPEIRSALEIAFERCTCGCIDMPFEGAAEHKLSLGQFTEVKLKPGCLMQMMFSEIVLYICHALAESAGAKNVSNLRGDETLVFLQEIVIDFLDEISQSGSVRWRSFFRIVCEVITGAHWTSSSLSMNRHGAAEGSPGVLIRVVGSITIIPLWLDLESGMELEGSWGIRQVNGSLVGVESDIALLEAQPSTAPGTVHHPDEVLVSQDTMPACDGAVGLEIAVFSQTSEKYRIAFLAKTDSAMRILDPFDVYLGLIHAKRVKCAHYSAKEILVIKWDINSIILGWDREIQWSLAEELPLGRDLGIHLDTGSSGGGGSGGGDDDDGDGRSPGSDSGSDSYNNHNERGKLPHVGFVGCGPGWVLKRNVAVGFSAGNCVLQNGDCCMSCFAQECRECESYGIHTGGQATGRELVHNRLTST